MRKRLVEGVDNRIIGAVRFRRLVKAYADSLGGMAGLSEAERALVRQSAMLTMKAEDLQAAVVRGEHVDPDAIVRLSSEARRALERLERRRKAEPKDPGQSLKDYLAARSAAA